MARQRHVYPTDEIPHLWAHATQESARNPGGNLFFEGATLYSYRTSYPIAHIFKKKNRPSVGERGPGPLLNATVRDAHEGKTLVLHCENTYSVTTAKHCSMARRATSHLPSIIVPYVRPDDSFAASVKESHARNIAYLVELAAGHLKKAQRAMTRSAVAWRAEAAATALRDAAAYSKFFGIRRKVPAYPAADWTAALQRAERIENPDPASADKRERASAQRKAMNAARDEYKEAQRRSIEAARKAAEYWPTMAKRTDWRIGGAFGAGDMRYENYGHRSSPVMLRLTHEDSDGPQIETSQGARIPAADAPYLWRAVEFWRERGGRVLTDRERAAHRAGQYAVDQIDADGTLHVGCHTIPHSELRAMARALNLAAE